MAAETIELPAPLVRSAALDIMGFAIFHAPPEVQRDAYLRLTQLAGQGRLKVDLDVMPLSDLGSAWERQRHGAHTKLVISCQ
jgi:hypothetical protein